MLYTSYFGNHREFPKGRTCISIARYTPGYSDSISCTQLAPNPEHLARWKSNGMSTCEFAHLYLQQLQSISDNCWDSLRKLANSQESVIFLCYERPESFCHRHILRAFLNNLGIKCEELGASNNVFDIKKFMECNHLYFR